MPMLLIALSSSIIIPPVCGRRRSHWVVLNVHTDARQRLVPNRARRQSLPHPLHRTGLPEFLCEWRAECIHNLCLARRLSARCNLPATIGDRRGYMRSLQRGHIGEERCFLMVPVNEDMTHRREDIGGATLWERNNFLSFGGEKGRDGLCGGVLYSARAWPKIRVSRRMRVGHRSYPSVCVRAGISSTGDNPQMRSRRGAVRVMHTHRRRLSRRRLRV
jgi:hypothetical protein